MPSKEELATAIAAVETQISGIENGSRWIDTLVLWAAALVAIGVLAEAVLGIFHWRNDRALRPLREQQRQLHEQELESMRADTAAANERTAEIMAASAWRQLDQKQQQELVAVLARHPDKVHISWIANDPESLALASQLSSLFTAARWNVRGSANTYPNNLLWEIWVPNGPASTATIREAFQNASIHLITDQPPVPGMLMGTTPDPAIALVLVGSRQPKLSQPPR
jgi:hypothetical protein